MKIRKAKKEDLKKIEEIFRIETFKKPYSQRWTKQTALKKIEDSFKKHDIYFCEVDREIVGFVICEINKTHKTVYVKEIWFTQKYQGKGFGTQIMKEIERIYQKRNFKSISLVSDKRTNAYNFYKKLGYKSHSINVFMEKKLK